MRRFHNVMVHRYDKVDDIKVYYIVQNRLGDLYEFKEEVPRVFEERGFLTGYLVGDVGSKWWGLVGDGYHHPALFWVGLCWGGGHGFLIKMCQPPHTFCHVFSVDFQQIFFQRKMSGAKSSKIVEVRKLFEENGIYDAVENTTIARCATVNEPVVYMSMKQADASIIREDLVVTVKRWRSWRYLANRTSQRSSRSERSCFPNRRMLQRSLWILLRPGRKSDL